MVRFVRPIINQILKQQKRRITQYVGQEYGQIAGGIAGIAISAFAGDYYGAISSLSNNIRDGKPNERNPAFGYYEGESTVDGTSNGSLGEALYSTNVGFSQYRFKSKYKYRKCSCRTNKPKRGSTRKYHKGRIPRNMGYR